MSSQGAEHGGLLGTGEDGEDPEDVALPLMENAEAPRIGLKGSAGKGGNRLDLTRKRAGAEPQQIPQDLIAFPARYAIEVALSPAHEPETISGCAGHAGRPAG